MGSVSSVVSHDDTSDIRSCLYNLSHSFPFEITCIHEFVGDLYVIDFSTCLWSLQSDTLQMCIYSMSMYTNMGYVVNKSAYSTTTLLYTCHLFQRTRDDQ